jgi:aryl-alcohol dehydrogenase-like predicted oxidoreductase
VRYIEVGGARLSVIGLGTWQFGSNEWGYGVRYASLTAGRLVTRALDLGINLIDTAEIYGLGRSERVVGAALTGRRSEAFVATKIFPSLPAAPVVRWRAHASAHRLRTRLLDLYQIHWPNRLVPISSQAAGLRRLLDDGTIAHAGVSNFSLDLWRETEHALGRPVLSNQVQFNLLQRRPRWELLPYAEAEGRLVIAYSPLAQGLLSGRYTAGRRPRNGVRRLNAMFSVRNLALAEAVVAELAAVGRPHGATPSQVALAWLVRQPNVVAIPGASSVEQLEENAAAANLELGEDEMERLDAAADRFWIG